MTRAKDWAVRSEARGGLARDATLPLSTLPPDLQAVLEHATLLVTQSATAHEQVWPPVLEALIRTAPGIEGATLAVRDGEHFVIRAQHGYAPDLLGLELPLYAERAWYGLSDQDWRDGRARLLEEEEVQAHVGWMKRTLGHLPHYARLERFGRLPEMRCSLLVPLVLDGEVRAHLNLDGYAGPALGAPGSASWVQGCTALLTMLLAVVNSARRAGQFQRLREERDALRVHLQLSERLRRCTQHDEILQVGLRLIQEGFAAETGLLIGPAHVTCTDGRTVDRAALRPSPLGYTVLAAGVLGHPEALELLTVPCGDGHVLGLAWRSGHIRQPDLVTARCSTWLSGPSRPRRARRSMPRCGRRRTGRCSWRGSRWKRGTSKRAVTRNGWWRSRPSLARPWDCRTRRSGRCMPGRPCTTSAS